LVAFFPLYLQLSKSASAPAFLAKANALKSFKLGHISLSSHQLAAVGVGLCALFAALGLGYILYSFRKTVSAEIYFYAFWVLSVGLEVLRLAIFGLVVADSSVYWQIVAAKGLLFARYSGYFALFMSGLYAAGFRDEKLGSVIAIALAIALALAITMPVNTGSFSATLELKPGYEPLNDGLFYVVAVVTVLNYLYAARATGEGSYTLVAIGAAIFLSGYRLLTSQWSPFALVLGFALLASGSWLYVSRLHAYYLWQ
jgi:hypothetical protein